VTAQDVSHHTCLDRQATEQPSPSPVRDEDRADVAGLDRQATEQPFLFQESIERVRVRVRAVVPHVQINTRWLGSLRSLDRQAIEQSFPPTYDLTCSLDCQATEQPFPPRGAVPLRDRLSGVSIVRRPSSRSPLNRCSRRGSVHASRSPGDRAAIPTGVRLDRQATEQPFPRPSLPHSSIRELCLDRQATEQLFPPKTLSGAIDAAVFRGKLSRCHPWYRRPGDSPS